MTKILLLASALLFLNSCASLFIDQRPFKASSMDKNDQKPHTLILKKTNAEAVAVRIIALAKERSYQITKKECAEDRTSCVLVFKGSPRNKQVTVGSGYSGERGGTSSVDTFNMQKESRFLHPSVPKGKVSTSKWWVSLSLISI